MNQRYTKWIVGTAIFLLILNLVFLAALLMRRSASGSHRPAAPTRFLSFRLGLDDVQQTELEALVAAHKLEIQAVGRELQEARSAYVNTLQDSTPDSIKQERLEIIGKRQMRFDSLNLLHFQDIRQILRPEQQATFDELLHELIRRGGPPKGRMRRHRRQQDG